MIDRAACWKIVTDHVQEVGLRRHMLAVEAATRWYAERLGGDPDSWGLAGLLHDFDWEIHPSIERHPKEGIPILRARGVDDEALLHAIEAHNTEGTGVPRETALDFALLACDEITGLIIAGALVRPHKDLRQLTVKSVQKNFKEKIFAAGVDRDHVTQVTAEFSTACYVGQLGLWDHVGNVLTAMQGVAAELELDGRLALTPTPLPHSGRGAQE
jgi:putative nucleotidyltransferase with HDIG domain